MRHLTNQEAGTIRKLVSAIASESEDALADALTEVYSSALLTTIQGLASVIDMTNERITRSEASAPANIDYLAEAIVGTPPLRSVNITASDARRMLELALTEREWDIGEHSIEEAVALLAATTVGILHLAQNGNGLTAALDAVLGEVMVGDLADLA